MMRSLHRQRQDHRPSLDLSRFLIQPVFRRINNSRCKDLCLDRPESVGGEVFFALETHYMFCHRIYLRKTCSHVWCGRRSRQTLNAKISRLTSIRQMGGTKRHAAATGKDSSPRSKKQKVEVPEYHLTPSVQADDGRIIWPAPEEKMEMARNFIREWYRIILLPS